jgi:hypothetical protein
LVGCLRAAEATDRVACEGVGCLVDCLQEYCDAVGEGHCPCMSVSSRTETLRETMLKKTWGSASLRNNFKRLEET